MSTTNSTAASVEALIAGDALKAAEALPVLTAAINAGSASLTADQHADIVTKTADLAQAVVPSFTAAAGAGLIGSGDAAHIQEAATAIAAAAPAATILEKFISWLRSL